MGRFVQCFTTLIIFYIFYFQHVYAFTSCIPPRPIFNAGLCYKSCPPGFFGVGPLCWADTECGPNHTDTGAFCHKKFYGRGIGRPLRPVCPSDKELNGLLCYPNCRSGYRGVGPVCWEKCRPEYKDHGATCYKGVFNWYFKKSYGRGVGNMPRYICDSGLEEGTLLCYRPCRSAFKGVGPVCWAKGCPPGMINIGVACAKHTVGRGAGTIPGRCTSSSVARSPALSVSTASQFNLIIANDPQLPWWQVNNNGAVCGSETCKKKNAEKEALYQVRAMNNVIALGKWPGTNRKITKPIGVIINGDLTAFFHAWQFDLFERYYVKESNAPHKDVLDYPLYLALGNHDYDNNLNDCYWLREPRYGVLGRNGCAQKAVDYMKGMVSCGRIGTFPGGKIESYDSGSLAYSWNMGSYHFIQLHNYPAYEVSSIRVQKSMAWLRKDLDRAKNATRKIVVNLHDLDDHFKAEEKVEFEGLLKKYTVVGIFTGHEISSENLGFQRRFGSTGIPVFRGGHAGEENRNKFLLVEFAETYYRVVSVTSSDGAAKFVGAGKFDVTISV